MRYGVDRSTLRTEVQINAGISTGPGNATQNAERVNYLLNLVERQMALEDEWPTLQVELEQSVDADTDIVVMPLGFGFSDILEIHTAFGGDWLPLTAGIGARERSIYGPNERSTPFMRYEAKAPIDERKIELWPVSSQAETIRYTYMSPVGAMEDDADVCVLDADVLVLRVAATLLTKTDKDKAAWMLKEAKRMKDHILGRSIGRKAEPTNWAARPGKAMRAGIDYIPPE